MRSARRPSPPIARSILSRAIAVAAALMIGPRSSKGQEAVVPLALEVSLVARVAMFERGLRSKPDERIRVLIVEQAGLARSRAAAAQLMARFEEMQEIASKPIEVERISFTTPVELAQACEARSAAIAFFTPGFDHEQIRAAAGALQSLQVLSVGAVASYVEDGVVLGFDLVSGKPKLIVNLGQARRQRLDFESPFLSIVKVIP
jgi:uncharacterized protein DUF4154